MLVCVTCRGKRDVGKIRIWNSETLLDPIRVGEIKRNKRDEKEKSSLKGNSNFPRRFGYKIGGMHREMYAIYFVTRS